MRKQICVEAKITYTEADGRRYGFVGGRLVSSSDLIQRVYRFQCNSAILKVICTGIGFGSGTETKSRYGYINSFCKVSWFLSTKALPVFQQLLCPEEANFWKFLSFKLATGNLLAIFM